LQISDFQHRLEEAKSIQGYVPFCVAAFFKKVKFAITLNADICHFGDTPISRDLKRRFPFYSQHIAKAAF
jgi:hypothetical protein